MRYVVIDTNVIVSALLAQDQLPDPKDVCFYEAAAVYEDMGVCLVTGNMKHYPDCPFAVTPAQMKERLASTLPL